MTDDPTANATLGERFPDLDWLSIVELLDIAADRVLESSPYLWSEWQLGDRNELLDAYHFVDVGVLEFRVRSHRLLTLTDLEP